MIYKSLYDMMKAKYDARVKAIKTAKIQDARIRRRFDIRYASHANYTCRSRSYHMTNLPEQYKWLDHEPSPKMLVEMLKLYGTLEAAGSSNNPVIMSWAKEIGEPYPNDATAWCGLTIGVAAKRAGWESRPKGNALWARNWASWGLAQKTAMLGDVLVFERGSGGHVAIYVGEDKDHYHILGGNQSDKVSIVRKPKKPILAIRRAPWKKKQPPNVRVVPLGPKGPVSAKES